MATAQTSAATGLAASVKTVMVSSTACLVGRGRGAHDPRRDEGEQAPAGR